MPIVPPAPPQTDTAVAAPATSLPALTVLPPQMRQQRRTKASADAFDVEELIQLVAETELQRERKAQPAAPAKRRVFYMTEPAVSPARLIGALWAAASPSRKMDGGVKTSSVGSLSSQRSSNADSMAVESEAVQPAVEQVCYVPRADADILRL